MNIRQYAVAFMLCCASVLFTHETVADESVAQGQPFQQKTLDLLKSEYAEQAWLMLVWSVDCPPCFKELAIVKALVHKHKLLPIVIINADDDDSLAGARADVYKEFAIEKLPRFYFQDGQALISRQYIDSSWHGELPRTYFIDAKGKMRGKSGLLKKAHIQQWLSLPE